MKVKFVVASFVLAAMTGSAFAQYSVHWSKIAGGGGTSTGGVYSLNGTMGQHDAGGPSSGGAFSLAGGFWTLPLAVPTEGAPALTITPAAPGFISISWTPNPPGFVLQEKAELNTAPWLNVAGNPTNGMVLPANAAAGFYRLSKP